MTPSPPIDLLVVDDDLEFRETLVTRFARAGFAVQSAGDGEEALGLAQRRNFDVAVFDIMMPGMSGLELLGHIKQKYHRPPPVVMMITAYGDAENYDMAKKLGADEFLTKPVDFTLLKEN